MSVTVREGMQEIYPLFSKDLQEGSFYENNIGQVVTLASRYSFRPVRQNGSFSINVESGLGSYSVGDSFIINVGNGAGGYRVDDIELKYRLLKNAEIVIKTDEQGRSK